ncbi:MAG: fumarylacetoacetase [Phycisphaerae bacterium]
MTNMIDPSLRSFVPVDAESHFPIQNLPYGVFTSGANREPHVGVAIGDHVLDLAILEEKGHFASVLGSGSRVFDSASLNPFMRMGRTSWQGVRQTVCDLLREDQATLRDDESLRSACLLPQASVTMQMPVEVGDYTDFYSSKEHASNVGTMFRGKENALMPNYLWIPVGYHGRAGSVVLSGTDLVRPCGQTKSDDADAPSFVASRLVDFELEMGFFVGPETGLGERVDVEKAEDHIFGMVLVNDWSARDIQRWEYVPLGPFLGKNFGTSISPWVVSLDALEPFRTQGPTQDPTPLSYLETSGPKAFDIKLEVTLQSPEMDTPAVICRSNFKYLYWSMAQQLAHHTVNGCNVRTGDLMASGTISGPSPESYGSMLELCWKGERPIQLGNGLERKFILDGDRITMSGYCQGEGYRVGFGEVTGKILPATLPT